MLRGRRKKKDRDAEREVAVKIISGGSIRNVSFEEFVLSLNLSLEALMSVLFKKGIITPEELIGEIEVIRDRHKERLERVPGGDTGLDAGGGESAHE